LFKNQNNDDKRTTASPNNPNIVDLLPHPGPGIDSARSSIKYNKNEFFRVTRKKMLEFTVINCEDKNGMNEDEQTLIKDN
jgi:hypothetical protein